MRQLKYHEKKLLKKVNFLQWKSDDNQRELQVRQREAFRRPGRSPLLSPAVRLLGAYNRATYRL